MLHYYSQERITTFVTLIMSFAVVTLLIIPIGILYYLAVILNTRFADTICLAVLLISTLIFSMSLLVFTAAKRHEVLGSVAA